MMEGGKQTIQKYRLVASFSTYYLSSTGTSIQAFGMLEETSTAIPNCGSYLFSASTTKKIGV